MKIDKTTFTPCRLVSTGLCLATLCALCSASLFAPFEASRESQVEKIRNASEKTRLDEMFRANGKELAEYFKSIEHDKAMQHMQEMSDRLAQSSRTVQEQMANKLNARLIAERPELLPLAVRVLDTNELTSRFKGLNSQEQTALLTSYEELATEAFKSKEQKLIDKLQELAANFNLADRRFKQAFNRAKLRADALSQISDFAEDAHKNVTTIVNKIKAKEALSSDERSKLTTILKDATDLLGNIDSEESKNLSYDELKQMREKVQDLYNVLQPLTADPALHAATDEFLTNLVKAQIKTVLAMLTIKAAAKEPISWFRAFLNNLARTLWSPGAFFGTSKETLTLWRMPYVVSRDLDKRIDEDLRQMMSKITQIDALKSLDKEQLQKSLGKDNAAQKLAQAEESIAQLEKERFQLSNEIDALNALQDTFLDMLGDRVSNAMRRGEELSTGVQQKIQKTRKKQDENRQIMLSKFIDAAQKDVTDKSKHQALIKELSAMLTYMDQHPPTKAESELLLKTLNEKIIAKSEDKDAEALFLIAKLEELAGRPDARDAQSLRIYSEFIKAQETADIAEATNKFFVMQRELVALKKDIKALNLSDTEEILENLGKASLSELMLTLDVLHQLSTYVGLPADEKVRAARKEDVKKRMADFLKGGQIIFPDEDAALYREWTKFKNNLVSRKGASSHQSDDEQFAVRGPFVKEALFGTRTTIDGQKHTWLQLESHPTGLRYLLGHLISYVIYKITGMNIGPYGRSVYTEKSPMELRKTARQIEEAEGGQYASAGTPEEQAEASAILGVCETPQQQAPLIITLTPPQPEKPFNPNEQPPVLSK